MLTGANLDGATLKYINLARADLRLASLIGTDLTQAYLYLTRLEGVDLSQSKGLEQAQLAYTCGDAETALPRGLAPPPTWPCKWHQD